MSVVAEDMTDSAENIELTTVPKNTVEIRGQVKNPGEIVYHPEADLFYYLRQAGGSTQQGTRNVMIVREEGARKRSLSYDLLRVDRPPEVKSGDILIFHGVINQPKSELRSVGANYAESPIHPERVQSKAALESLIRKPEFKRLLNQIITVQAEQGYKSIAVLSLYAGEGKSLFISALALAYAQYLNSRVLVVDTVKQTTDKTLYFERVAGELFPEVLGTRAIEQGHVDFLTTTSLAGGRKEATDFQVGRYIDSLRNRYDVILMDTSALKQGTDDTLDPVVLARFADAAVLLTSRKSLNRKQLMEIDEIFHSNRVPLIGTVYNGGMR